MVTDEAEDVIERRRSSVGLVSACLIDRDSDEPDVLDLAGSSTIEGLPEKITETTRAVIAMVRGFL